MPLYLAMSCFQGRLQNEAFDALRAHDPDGIQLTPGNLPEPDFRQRVEASGITTIPHHGFAWSSYRRRVWDEHARPIAIEAHRSVHPPKQRELCCGNHAWLESVAAEDVLLETMYPGYVLGSGEDLECAMRLGIRLAVDVSHLHIQRTLGTLRRRTLSRVFDYDRIAEIHMSANDGRRDTHAPLEPNTPGLAFARERLPTTPVVLESLWHRTSFDRQCHQVELLR